jgi:hypothetical protein
MEMMGEGCMPEEPEQYNEQQTRRRLQKVLRGAFDGPPTPLKDIPKKGGVSRAKAKKRPQRKRVRQRKNRAA